MSTETAPLYAVRVEPVVGRLICQCGCGRKADWLASGEDFDGAKFVDEPMCESAHSYVSEAAHLCGKPFSSRRVAAPNAALEGRASEGEGKHNDA